MDSFKDVLEAAQAYCKTQMAEPTYNLYIDGLEPISFEDSSHITLSVRNDFICKIVTDRYLGLLKEAFKTVLGFDVDITLVVPSTPPHEVVLAQQYEANPASPQGNYEFTFENFIKGPSNQFAFAAAQAVAANPSGAYNPLFIYGGSGLGKTHLLTAIQTEIKRTHPDFVIMYVTCEQFTNELIAAIRAGSTEDFRMKYRVADLLLVDDVQFISGKEKTVEEFLHTFDALFHAHKTIVLCADAAACDISNLDVRLAARLESGLTVELTLPGDEDRLEILRSKRDRAGMNVSDEILEFLASRIQKSVRRLEGALLRVATFTSLSGDMPDISKIEQLLRDILREETSRVLSVETIQKRVADFYELKVSDLTGKRRPNSIAFPRQIAMYLSRRLTECSLKDIGNAFGGRDHGTVIHANKLVASRMENDVRVRDIVLRLEEDLQG